MQVSSARERADGAIRSAADRRPVGQDPALAPETTPAPARGACPYLKSNPLLNRSSCPRSFARLFHFHAQPESSVGYGGIVIGLETPGFATDYTHRNGSVTSRLNDRRVVVLSSCPPNG